MTFRRRSPFQYFSLDIDTSANASSEIKSVQYGNTTIRSLRLQAIQQLTVWGLVRERKKTAIYCNRGIVVLHSLIHAIPLGASTVLVFLNCGNIKVKDEVHISPTTLQFAAKLLEVLIQSSIASIVLAFIRGAALGPDAIPLGALIGSFRITDISYLWSLKFWGSSSSSRLCRLRRTMLTLVLLLSVILATLVDPSCAVVMIPRLVNNDPDEMLMFLGQSNLVYPTSIDENVTASDIQ